MADHEKREALVAELAMILADWEKRWAERQAYWEKQWAEGLADWEKRWAERQAYWEKRWAATREAEMGEATEPDAPTRPLQ